MERPNKAGDNPPKKCPRKRKQISNNIRVRLVTMFEPVVRHPADTNTFPLHIGNS